MKMEPGLFSAEVAICCQLSNTSAVQRLNRFIGLQLWGPNSRMIALGCELVKCENIIGKFTSNLLSFLMARFWTHSTCLAIFNCIANKYD